MKKLKIFTIAAIAGNTMLCAVPSFAQKVTFDSLSKQRVTVSPGINNDDLVETIIIEQEDCFVWSGISVLKSCAEFQKFKTDYPQFIIPKKVIARFSRCK